jgi:DNA polymerase
MWSERQQRMLEEMGLRVYGPPAGRGVTGTPAAPAGDAGPGTEAPAAPVGDARAPAAWGAPGADAARDAARPPAATPPARPARPEAAASAASEANAAVAAMGWAELRAAVASCRACGLCDTRRQTVFGVGHERAHWMIVGEAPGEQEDRQGEPFVGPAGQLLDAMLRALGLTRSEAPPERQVYIANTLKCRPPGNRNPEPAEMQRCEPFLVRQIELVRPRIILAMGRFAVQALLRSDEPVGRLRGRVHRYHGVPLVVTYHPAYLLRNPADKARAWDDLCLAAEVAETQSPMQDQAA